MPPNSRLFISINPPSEVRNAIEGLYRSSLWPQEVRPTPAKNLHLSLHFIGEAVPWELLPAIKARFQEACAGAAPMRFAVRGIGCFPNANVKCPDVLFARVEGDVRLLDRLQQRIFHGITGSEDSRKFQPHITLGRPKGEVRLGELFRASQSLEFGSWMAHEVLLIKSELEWSGARYEVLDAAVLV